MTAMRRRVYQDYMDHATRQHLLRWLFFLAATVAGTISVGDGFAEDPPLTPNVPIEEFQNRGDITPSYNFNAPPEGIFRSVQFAEGFEEEMGFRRSHEIVPLTPTEVFRPDSRAVYMVFNVYPHPASFQIFGVCYPEQVEGLDPTTVVAQDEMYVTLEDDSGYVKLLAPPGGWKPGKYKVEIHVGWQVNQITLVGTMRFDVAPPSKTTSELVTPSK